MAAPACWAKGITFCLAFGEPWKCSQAEEGREQKEFTADKHGNGCGLDWRPGQSRREQRLPLWEFASFHCPQGHGGLAHRGPGAGEPALCESSPWASGDCGLSCGLTLCLPLGSECVTSCLDHNSESIILPVNVTVRDIPHWLNPTRVEVSDRADPGGSGRETTPLDTYYALVLNSSFRT